MSETPEAKNIKSMMNSLQRQRNVANDRIVDLEVALDAKHDHLVAVATDLNNAKEVNAQFKAALEASQVENSQLRSVLAQAAAKGAGTYSIIDEDGTYSVAEPIVLEAPIAPALVATVSDGFEDSTVTTDTPNNGKRTLFKK